MKCPRCGWEEEKAGGFDFDLVYLEYPRKLGKSAGIKKCRSRIKSAQKYEELRTAVRNFVEYHRARRTEIQFIPYFSTFMSHWEDWVSPEESPEVKLQAQRQQEHSDHFQSQAERVLKGEL